MYLPRGGSVLPAANNIILLDRRHQGGIKACEALGHGTVQKIPEKPDFVTAAFVFKSPIIPAKPKQP